MIDILASPPSAEQTSGQPAVAPMYSVSFGTTTTCPSILRGFHRIGRDLQNQQSATSSLLFLANDDPAP